MRTQLVVFSVLFSTAMWMSKVAQPLHFENAGALTAFGVGYAVMACVGGLSFAWGAVADRIGGLNAVRLGVLLYALGIGGRVFTDLAPAIASSAVAGAGASLALVGLRPWIKSSVSDEEIPRMVAARGVGSQIGVLVGTFGAAGLFLAAGDRGSGTTLALGIAALVALGGFLWVCGIRGGRKPLAVRPGMSEYDAGAGMRSIAVKLAAVGLLSGFYVSLITPYLPLYLTRTGLTDAGAALVVAGMSFIQICVTGILARRGTGTRPIKLFFFAEAAAAVATFGIAVVLALPPILTIVFFMARAALVAVAAMSEETIQYAVIPGNAAGFVFGISQTAFLVGDALGGALGGPLWNSLGPVPLAVIAGAATLINAVALPALFRTPRSAPRTELAGA
ncbi:MFS transporter [Leifsonia sp. fls2-241-R2A-40a]|uniref:MFS transporter n=1 Tax=Leifsonia sp. fls2-241-R2A-40a TaxID=3040290 RepID=UPI00254DB6AF|nr:MFS transporter [Leifsonia sp. fls2-241-R2A-40a]